jgi:integration host factor subunit beta
VTKKDMAVSIAAKSGIPPVRATEIVQQVFDGVIETLVQEGRLELRGFGVFQVKRRKARQGRNPRTGEAVSVPERLIITFKVGREVQERLNGVTGDCLKQGECREEKHASESWTEGGLS